MPYFSCNDEGFWDIGPESLRWMKVLAEAINVKFARFPLGDPDDDATPFASVLAMPPNYELWRHKHDCHRVEVVVSGSLQVGDRVLHPGDVMTSTPGEAYGPHVAGPEGSVTVEIFSNRRGVSFEFDANPDPQVVGFFERLLADPDPERRAAASVGLARSGLRIPERG
ncbi:MAG TPA: hypothetical protein VGQ20_05385 [Acidimicrobiales bacterium]|jgi:hypothetical protein|nr:hypothetical protein [Acidimicrobiales bacterium]